MQISLFNHQLIMLCLIRKDKGSAFNILRFQGIATLASSLQFTTQSILFFCHKACRLKLLSGNKRQKDAFVVAGFNNWKQSIQKFKEHEKCQMHIELCFKLNALCRPSVATQLSAQILQQQCFHREMLLKILSTLYLNLAMNPNWHHNDHQ